MSLALSWRLIAMAAGRVDPVVDDRVDIEVLERMWRVSSPSDRPVHTAIKNTQLTIARNSPHDFQDRQIYVFVDGESWGKIRYGQPMTRDIPPGAHTVRVNNTLLSASLDFDAVPGEHVRLRCCNGMPRAGWLMMIFLHVTYLLVRIERE